MRLSCLTKPLQQAAFSGVFACLQAGVDTILYISFVARFLDKTLLLSGFGWVVLLVVEKGNPSNAKVL
jgi:uncharacterized membrane protein